MWIQWEDGSAVRLSEDPWKAKLVSADAVCSGAEIQAPGLLRFDCAPQHAGWLALVLEDRRAALAHFEAGQQTIQLDPTPTTLTLPEGSHIRGGRVVVVPDHPDLAHLGQRMVTWQGDLLTSRVRDQRSQLHLSSGHRYRILWCSEGLIYGEGTFMHDGRRDYSFEWIDSRLAVREDEASPSASEMRD